MDLGRPGRFSIRIDFCVEALNELAGERCPFFWRKLKCRV